MSRHKTVTGRMISHLSDIGPGALDGISPDGISEVQVLPFGAHQSEKGGFRVDLEGLGLMAGDFRARRNEMVVDYEHQSLTGGEAPAAGWITELIARGRDGLWARVRWTERALGYLKSREYRYLSPVFLTEDATGRAVRLINVALTNQPAIDGMAPVVAKRTHGEEVKGMREISRMLGLEDTASEEEALDALRAIMAGRDALREKAGQSPPKGLPIELLAALGLSEGATLEEALGMAVALRRAHDETAELASRLEETASRLRAIETDALVESAMKDGKVTPAQRDWARQYAGRDPEGFSAFAAKAPVVLRHAGVAPARCRAEVSGLDELQQQANRITGVSDAMFLKHNARAPRNRAG